MVAVVNSVVVAAVAGVALAAAGVHPLALPSGVDAQAIKAQTRDGVVEVTVLLPSGATTQKVEITPAPASDEG